MRLGVPDWLGGAAPDWLAEVAWPRKAPIPGDDDAGGVRPGTT